MRVVIVSDAWYPQVNGVVTTLSQLKQNLEKKGYIVDLIEPSLFKTTSTTIYPEISLSINPCLLYTSPSPRDRLLSRMPSSA